MSEFKKFLKLSVVEGIFGQIFNSLCGPGSAFLTKFAIMLNATPLQFGILSAIGQISQIFQPLGALVTNKRRKRKGVVMALAFQLFNLTLIFIGLTGEITNTSISGRGEAMES